LYLNYCFMNRLEFRVAAIVLIYVLLKFFGGSFGRMALYPVTLLVTFLHEFGHALGAILTGGNVDDLKINWDGSGYTVTRGGNQAVILMGGYLGSAVLGNMLFYIGARLRTWTRPALLILAGLMVFAGIVWFVSLTTTATLLGFAALLWFIVNRTSWDRDVLMFLGLAAVLYIIQDFNVGPTSDLAMYEEVVGVFPSGTWMYIWLILVVALFIWNMRQVFSGRSWIEETTRRSSRRR
jgi:Peptidase M50B-like